MTLPLTHHAARRPVSSHTEPGLMALGVWTERRPGQGEDADPLLLHHRPTRCGVLGVFDGLGGAGSSIAWHDADGNARTDAWVASRMARLATESWFAGEIDDRRAWDSETQAPDIYTDLGAHLRQLFAGVRPTGRRSKVVGTMRRRLPTTVAALRYTARDSDVVCEALWAGDSRAYVLTPDAGLQALTRDHADDPDVLSQLVQDPQMTNMVSADREFFVQRQPYGRIPLPCVLLCATDGFFGYVQTPGDFEHVLLNTLCRSTDLDDWAARLTSTVASYTGDDASLALVALGFRTFDELRAGCAERFAWLDRDASAMPDPRGAEAMRHWRARAWERYRPGYEARLPPPLASDARSQGRTRDEGGTA
ncbi:Serine/threonine protein phosphatase PrpC [Streptomyces sp. SceaMP-e96]|uniref:serine/threonine protein phosphatase n=1 Tax=unclassified Streptomyces TaxID=2593676 RepID=UPI000823D340|nr:MULTISPECIES: serine/threonine protein phosphatase [unclassified Streptomyces]SCK53135.1 Serine/threonine protein phosphatase PrpC [Streptomyces sp. SceaMP-e96]